MSFKLIEDNYFICGIIVWFNLYVYSLKINNDFSIETLLSDELSEYLYFDSISSIGLYDTNKNNIKLLCRKTIKILFWNFIKITKEEKINIECIDDKNIVFTISNKLKEKYCYLFIFDQFYFAME